MLVLTRRPDQWTYLDLPNGQRIGVFVAECRDGKVRLGFEAPADVQIVRDDAHSLRPANSHARPACDAPQSAGNGAPRDFRANGRGNTPPAPPKPGEPGYVPLRRREGR